MVHRREIEEAVRLRNEPVTDVLGGERPGKQVRICVEETVEDVWPAVVYGPHHVSIAGSDCDPAYVAREMSPILERSRALRRRRQYACARIAAVGVVHDFHA